MDVEDLQRRCFHCYRVLWGNNVADVVNRAMQVISKVTENISKDPSLLKYRTLRRANKRVEKAIFTVHGARQLLQTLGFRYLRQVPDAEEDHPEQVLEDRVLTLPVEDSVGLQAVLWFHNGAMGSAFMKKPVDLKPIKLRFGVKLNTFVQELVVLFRPSETMQDLYRFVDEYEGLKLRGKYALLKLPSMEQLPSAWSNTLEPLVRSTLQVERLQESGALPERTASAEDVGDEKYQAEQRALAVAAMKKKEREEQAAERVKNLRNFNEDRARKNELEAFKARKRLLAKQRGQEQLQDYHYADEEEAPLVLKDQ